MDAAEETNLTEIELTADGRICIFGASREVLELLDAAGLADNRLQARLHHVQNTTSHELATTPGPSNDTSTQPPRIKEI